MNSHCAYYLLAQIGDGVVYSWGLSKSGQLGRSVDKRRPAELPCPIESLLDKKMAFISANEDNSAAISSYVIINF